MSLSGWKKRVRVPEFPWEGADSWEFAQTPGKPPRSRVPKTSAKFPFSAPSDSLFQWFPWKQILRHPPLQRAPGAGTPFFFLASQ